MDEVEIITSDQLDRPRRRQQKEKKERILRPRPSDFGKRFLEEDHDVFQHNAWDDVDFPPEQEVIVKETIEKQKESAVNEDQAKELITNPERKWNDFYSQHECKFFMDRKWLDKEAPELFQSGTEVY